MKIIKESEFTDEELRELSRMRRAYKRGHDLTSNMETSLRQLGLRHSIQQVEREADLTKKHKSSAEVVLSFLAGLTVGAFKAGHRFMFPTLPDHVDVTPKTSRHKKR